MLDVPIKWVVGWNERLSHHHRRMDFFIVLLYRVAISESSRDSTNRENESLLTQRCILQRSCSAYCKQTMRVDFLFGLSSKTFFNDSSSFQNSFQNNHSRNYSNLFRSSEASHFSAGKLSFESSCRKNIPY